MSDSKDDQNQGKQDDASKDAGAEDVTGLKTALQSERDARKAAEKSANDLKKRLADVENSGKSEGEKIAARLKALEDDNADKTTKLRERDAQDAVQSAATKAGSSTPDVVWRAVKSGVEFDADGKPANVETLVKDLKEVAPQLFRKPTGNADAGAGNGSRATPNSDWIRAGFAARRGG